MSPPGWWDCLPPMSAAEHALEACYHAARCWLGDLGLVSEYEDIFQATRRWYITQGRPVPQWLTDEEERLRAHQTPIRDTWGLGSFFGDESV